MVLIRAGSFYNHGVTETAIPGSSAQILSWVVLFHTPPQETATNDVVIVFLAKRW